MYRIQCHSPSQSCYSHEDARFVNPITFKANMQKTDKHKNLPTSRIKTIQHDLITLLTLQFQRLHVLVPLRRSAGLVRRGHGDGVPRLAHLIPQARSPSARMVGCLPENFDLAEQRCQGRERGGGQSEADFDGRPGGNGLEGVEVLGVVEDAVGVGEADNGGDGGAGVV